MATPPPQPNPERAMERQREYLDTESKHTPDSLEKIRAEVHGLHAQIESDPTERSLTSAWENIERTAEPFGREDETIRAAVEQCDRALENVDASVQTAIESLQELEKALTTNKRESNTEHESHATEAEHFTKIMNELMDGKLTEHRGEIEAQMHTLIDSSVAPTEHQLRQANASLDAVLTSSLNTAELSQKVLVILDVLIEQAKHATADAVETNGNIIPTEAVATETTPVQAPQEKKDSQAIDLAKLQALFQQQTQQPASAEAQPVEQAQDETDTSDTGDYDDDVPLQPGIKTDVAAAAVVATSAETEAANTDEMARANIKNTLLELTEGNTIDADVLDELAQKFITDHRETLDRIEVQPTFSGGIAIGETLSNKRIDTSKPCFIITSDQFQIIKKRFSQETIDWIQFGGPKVSETEFPAVNNTTHYARAA